MKQEGKRLSSMIIALLFLVVAGIVYFELIQPAYTNLQMEKGQAISETNLLASEKQTVSQVQSLITAYQSETTAQQSVSMALPVGQDLAGAIAQIYGIATNSGLVVQSLGDTVQSVSQQTPADQADASSSDNGAVVKPTGTITFQISLSGSYESLKTFLQGLEGNIRLFDVTSVAVHPGGVTSAKGSASSQDIYTFNIVANTYYQAP